MLPPSVRHESRFRRLSSENTFDNHSPGFAIPTATSTHRQTCIARVVRRAAGKNTCVSHRGPRFPPFPQAFDGAKVATVRTVSRQHHFGPPEVLHQGRLLAKYATKLTRLIFHEDGERPPTRPWLVVRGWSVAALGDVFTGKRNDFRIRPDRWQCIPASLVMRVVATPG